MKLPMDLLQELMQVSPTIAAHVTTMSYLDKIKTMDSVTIKDVINDCFLILIGELEQQGFQFHNTGGYAELLEDYHQAEYLVTLYQRFSIEPFTKLLSNNLVMSKIIRDILDTDISDNEIIIFILQAFMDTNYYPDMKDVFCFFQDKLISTPLYTKYLRDFITTMDDKSYIDNVDSTELLLFINILMGERRIFGVIMNTLSKDYNLNEDEITIAVDTFRNDLIYFNQFNSIVTLLNKGDRANIALLIDKLKETDKVYMENRNRRKDIPPISDLDCIINIATVLSNERIFNIPADFTLLREVREDVDEILTKIHQLNIGRHND